MIRASVAVAAAALLAGCVNLSRTEAVEPAPAELVRGPHGARVVVAARDPGARHQF